MGDLCTACLCGGRNLFFIGETGYYHLYSQILNEIPVYDLSQLCIRVCWECRALLRRLDAFKQQVKRSYTQLLQYVHQSDLTKTLMSNIPHLQIKHVNNISIPENEIKTEVLEDCVKREIEIETHCEPETFVNDLDVEPPKRKKDIKKEKLTKQKSKKKLKKQKSMNKNKVKVKEKPVLTEELPIEDNEYRSDVDADTGDYESNGVSKTEPENVGIEINVDIIPEAVPEMTNGVDNVVKAAREPRSREVLPDKPQCAECGKNFSSRKTYRYHLNVLHKGQNRYPCPRCGKVYQWKSNLGRHIRSHKARDSGELYCAVCDKRFASVATFRQHLRVSRRHVSETEFTFMCNECGKKFVNKTRLRDHIDWEHLNKIKFKCQLCNKPFKCHTSLYVHMQNVHRNKEKKDNLCHVCGKSYQNAAKLKYHIVAMHTSETPYQCEQCSAAFGWYSSLYRHVREVHYKMKVQPKKSKKTKKNEPLASLLPQIILPSIHHPGPVDQAQ